MASFSGDPNAAPLGTNHPPESSEKLKHELSKQALGLNGDIRLAFQLNENGSKGDSKSVFALHESLLDDEFDDVIDGNDVTKTMAKETGENVELNVKPFVTQSKDINEINRIWNQKKESLKVDEQMHFGKTDGKASSDIGLTLDEEVKSHAVGTMSLAEQIATNKGGLMYSLETRQQVEAESGSYNSKAKVAADMSLGLQNSTTISTFEYRHISDTSDHLSPAEIEVKRLQEIQDLRSMSSKQTPEREDKLQIDEFGKSSQSENLKDEVTVCYQNFSLNGVSSKENDEILSATSNVERENFEFCSVSEMMALFNDPGLSFSDIEPVVSLTGWKSVKRFIFGPPKLNRVLLRERDSIFALAKMPLDNSSKLHISILQTVFLKLVGPNEKFERYGMHWTQIGFQGSDPSTDLRSSGMLGLLQLALIITEHNHLISRLFSLSHHETANFPLAVLSINFTKICLGVLRNEKMNKLCNARKQVIDPFNDLFVAIWYHFDDMWNEESTISDIAFMLKDIENLIIDNLNQFLVFAKKLQSLSAASKNSPETEPQNVTSKSLGVKEKEKLSKYAVGSEPDSKPGSSTREFVDVRKEKCGSNVEMDFVGIEDIPEN